MENVKEIILKDKATVRNICATYRVNGNKLTDDINPWVDECKSLGISSENIAEINGIIVASDAAELARNKKVAKEQAVYGNNGKPTLKDIFTAASNN